MRASEIALYVICFNAATALLAPTGIFGTGPEGTEVTSTYFVLALAIGALSLGGVSILGFSFKVPAVITFFGGICLACITMMGTLLYQMHVPGEIITTLVFIVGVVDVIALIQIAGGAHGPMD